MADDGLRISVVIPTHNRWGQLGRALEGYRAQSVGPAAFEVLVCDDASDDDTPDRVRAFAARAPYRLRYLRQEKAGPAAARNLGIGAATAPAIALTDDDCVPRPDLLARHLASTRPGVATIGHLAWHPDVAVTPFMAFLQPGYRFDYSLIADPRDATFRCFYTANVSAWRDDLLAVGGFDEGFPAAAFEDIELGYRLHRRGVRLAYDAAAIVDHLHEMRLEPMLRSQVLNGRSAAYAVTKHPDLAFVAGMTGVRDPAVAQRFYRAAMDYYFIAGLQQGLEGHFADEWPERLEELLKDNVDYRSAVEQQFTAAQAYAERLEARVAELEEAHRALAGHAQRLDRALAAANPIKSRLRRAAPGLRRAVARRG